MSNYPGYPYFETKLWTGRLRASVEVRGTVARQFECGSIGGKKIERTERFEDTAEGRARLQRCASGHQHDQLEIEYIISPTRHRVLIKMQIVLQPAFPAEGVPRSSLR